MKLTLSYQPLELPPPFAYASVLQVDLSSMECKFQLEYLGRDEVSDDELRAEGFTRNDDFLWEGKLNPNWKNDVKKLTEGPFSTSPNESIYLYIQVDDNEKGFPVDMDLSSLVFQEVLQAILEISKIEQPLQILIHCGNNQYSVKWNFENRTIEINDKKSAQWEAGRLLMKDIYKLDFEQLVKSKKSKSNSMNIGNGIWYQLEENYASKILKSIEEIIH